MVEGKHPVPTDTQLPIQATDSNGDVQMSENQPSIEGEHSIEPPNNKAVDGAEAQAQEDLRSVAMDTDTTEEQGASVEDPPVPSDSQSNKGPLSDTEQDLKTITDFFSANVEKGQATGTWHQLEAKASSGTFHNQSSF